MKYNFFAGIQDLEYHPLLLSTEIRLVRLLNHGLVSFRTPTLYLKAFDLSDKLPAYAALSYTWGPAEAEGMESIEASGLRSILVNSRRLDVYPNLFDALCQLASSGYQEYFWIDAICINQSDDRERSNQVAMMDAIYKNASKTVVWLGKESPHTARAIEILSASSKIARQVVLDIGKSGQWAEPINKADRSGFEQYGLPKLQERDWKALEDIYGRRYFGRVWMTQEVALPRRLKMVCGRLEFKWEDIAALGAFLSLNNSLPGLLLESSGITPARIRMGKGALHIMAMHVTRLRCCTEDDAALLSVAEKFNWTVSTDEKVGTFGGTLFKLLQLNSGFAATELKDKIFSHYGIVKHMHPRQSIFSKWYTPRYELSVVDVFTRFCQGLIQETKVLHVLSFAGDSYPTDNPALPSWVPDWSLSHPPSLHGFFAPSARYATLNASGPQGDAHCTYAIDGTKLYVSACEVGKVLAIGETWAEWMRTCLTESTQMLSHVAPIYPYTNQSRTEAFWRTLVTDHDLSSRPAPAELGNSFRSIFKVVLLKLITDLFKTGATELEVKTTYHTIDCYARMEVPVGQFFPTWHEMRIPLIRLGHIPLPEDGSIERFEQTMATAYINGLVAAAQKYETIISYSMVGRRSFATNYGHLGCGPKSTAIGDSVWIIAGCASPLVLRKITDSSYHIIGETYMHGIMNGEALSNNAEWRNICFL